MRPVENQKVKRLTTSSHSLAHTPLHRTELLLGAAVMKKIQAAKVILFGVGGVGSWCAEALVRSGIRQLTMVDPDLVCPTNINRQLQATIRTVGHVKVEELRLRLLEINPDAAIITRREMYDETTCDSFDLGAYDYVIDAIDTLRCKTLLIQRSLAAPVTLYSSMGAGSKLDGTQLRVAPISKTKHCGLARAVRQRLRQEQTMGEFLCVYSEELAAENRGQTFCGSACCACPDQEEKNLCRGKAKINGTLVHVTAPFGFALAGLVIQDLAGTVTHDATASPFPASIV